MTYVGRANKIDLISTFFPPFDNHLPVQPFTMTLIGRTLALALCSTLSNQQLSEKHLENHLLNANALQMLSGQCSHMKLLEENLHL